jgi:hypothetical protein
VNDVTPPFVQLVTQRVSTGRPLLIARTLDLGSGVDPLSLVLAYRRVLVGASAYDPASGFVLFGLPREAPALKAGRTRVTVVASDYQETKNVNTLGNEILPNTSYLGRSIRAVAGPAVTWLVPEAGQCAARTERLLVAASATHKLREVRFLVDGRRIGKDRSGPDGLYALPWKTRGKKTGPHRLTAVALDAAGKRAAASRTVRVCAR